jgi:predicted P-loop ATPase
MTGIDDIVRDLKAERDKRKAKTKALPWLDLCIKENKKPLPILANAYIALENDPSLKNIYGYDEMRREVTVRRSETRVRTDEDIADLTRYLQAAGLKRVSITTVHEAVEDYARKHAYHPLRDYLDGLVWDGTARLDTWVTTYLGTEPSDYAATVGTMFLVAMAARIYEPGCKAQYMLILEGPQGELKSSACKILAGDYFSDQELDLDHGKEVSIHIKGLWLQEIAELHVFGRIEASHLKSFISRREERYRPVYGRSEVVEPRHCLFIGTSNKDAYLRDETGGRRFWPLKCGTINLDALETDRDQLFAEAVLLYRTGHPWWPERAFEKTVIAAEQEARYEFDEWANDVENFLATCSTTTMASVAKAALYLDIKDLSMLQQKRLAAIMVHAGWERKASMGRRWWQRRNTPSTP